MPNRCPHTAWFLTNLKLIYFGEMRRILGRHDISLTSLWSKIITLMGMSITWIVLHQDKQREMEA